MDKNFPPYTPGLTPNLFHRRCPSNTVLDMIADKWSALIIARLSEGTRRHGELLGSIEGISQRMLTQTLRELERNGFVTRTAYATVPMRVDYELTPLGRHLHDTALKAMCAWATTHMGDVAAARTAFEEKNEERTAFQSN